MNEVSLHKDCGWWEKRESEEGLRMTMQRKESEEGLGVVLENEWNERVRKICGWWAEEEWIGFGDDEWKCKEDYGWVQGDSVVILWVKSGIGRIVSDKWTERLRRECKEWARKNCGWCVKGNSEEGLYMISTRRKWERIVSDEWQGRADYGW
jgi:hypothetical protein